MKYLLITFLAAMNSFWTVAQPIYQAATIPKDLLPYASAVVRDMEASVEIKDLRSTVNHYKTIVTILNKNGDDNADIDIWYNKIYQIKYVKGVVYDEFGKVISKFSEKNFTDQSAGSGASMFEDSRMKHFQPAVINYPYTVEYEYEVVAKQSLNLDDWTPGDIPGTAVEHSKFEVIFKPQDFNIRYKEFNYLGKMATAINAKGQNVYTWEIGNLKALRTEPYSPNPEQYQTSVKIAPERFWYDGYDGTFNNWHSLGKWIYEKLLTGRTTLQPQTVSLVRSLTDTITNPKMKAKAIYEYMQNKSRYVSVQIGIGGYQPFLASEVDRLSYGDCKGLVNYTQALLKAANIDSYYCVVQAGSTKKSLIPDFASMTQANHIILCLPFKNDTTWLECTSKTSPFGFLGDFTDDRLVLACTAEGGKLLHTPKYTAQDSKQIRKAVLTLKPDGQLAGHMTTTFEGCQYENITDSPGDITDEIKKAKERYSIDNLEIERLTLKPVKSIQPVNYEEMDFTARDYASESAGRMYFVANLANRQKSVPREVRNRTTDVYINRGYTDVDEIVYDIPAGYKLDINPLAVNIDKPFGKYSATAFLNSKNQLVYQRKMELIDGTYPKSNYQDLVDFYQRVADADTYKFALVKAN